MQNITQGSFLSNGYGDIGRVPYGTKCGHHCVTLEEMGHEQNTTPIVVDNSTCYGFANNTLNQKHSKAIDTKHYLLQDCTK